MKETYYERDVDVTHTCTQHAHMCRILKYTLDTILWGGFDL